MNKETTLASLAMLKVRIDQGSDYLEYLRPFVLHVLGTKNIEIVTDDSVVSGLLEEFGIVIPRRTTQIVLKRIAKRDGPLKRENNAYKVVKEIPVSDLPQQRADASRRIAAVTNALIKYAQESHEKVISEDDAFEALTQFLSRFSISCIKSYLRGTALPNNVSDEHWQLQLVCRFVNHLNSSKPERFNDFILMVQGHMLANALLCPDLQSVSKTYSGVTFYLDTPLLLHVLGLEGDAKKSSTEELIRLLQQLSGNVSYFSHTLDELQSVIRKTADYVDSPDGRGHIIYEARRIGKTKSDLLLEAEKAKEVLDRLNLNCQSTPPYINSLQIDENAFGSSLDDEVSYNNPKARDNDINSVRSIYVLRKGSTPHSIETCKAIFVTSNSGFARAAYEYGRNIEQSRELSSVISDFSLANTAWLKAPQGAPTLPQKEVLAFSYAALRPSTDFLSKVLVEAEKLENQGRISARDHQLLRSNQNVQDELMSLTLGEDDALTEQSLKAALEKVETEIKKEEAEKLHAEQQLRSSIESELQVEREKRDALIQRIYWACNKKATRWANFFALILGLCVILAVVFGFIKKTDSPAFGWIILGFSAVFAILTIGNLVFGTTVENLREKIIESLRRRCLHKEKLRLELDELSEAMPACQESPKESQA